MAKLKKKDLKNIENDINNQDSVDGRKFIENNKALIKEYYREDGKYKRASVAKVVLGLGTLVMLPAGIALAPVIGYAAIAVQAGLIAGFTKSVFDSSNSASKKEKIYRLGLDTKAILQRKGLYAQFQKEYEEELDAEMC